MSIGIDGGSNSTNETQATNETEKTDNKPEPEKYKYRGQIKGLEQLDEIHPGLSAIAEGLILAAINKMKKDQDKIKQAMRGRQ